MVGRAAGEVKKAKCEEIDRATRSCRAAETETDSVSPRTPHGLVAHVTGERLGALALARTRAGGSSSDLEPQRVISVARVGETVDLDVVRPGLELRGQRLGRERLGFGD